MIGGSSYSEVACRVALGQLMSMLMSFTGVFTTLLVNRNQSYPLLQSTCVYAAIALVTVPVLLRRLKDHKRAEEKAKPKPYDQEDRVGEGGDAQVTENKNPYPVPHAWWKYALIALCDLEANFTVVLAYKYTDLTSVQLLDCFTVPCVMVLARLLVKPIPTYNRLQFLGVGIASLGIVALVIIDTYGYSRSKNSSDEREAGKNVLLGDCLCLLASFLYALSNVLCEKLLKQEQNDKRDEERKEDLVVKTSSEASDGPAAVTDSPRTEAPTPSSACTEKTSCLEKKLHATEEDPPGVAKEGQQLQRRAADEEESQQPAVAKTTKEEKIVEQQEPPPPPPLREVLSSTFCYLAMMSMFAFSFSIVQLVTLDLHSISSGTRTSSSEGGGWSREDTGAMFGFVLSMLLIYITMPLLFVYTSAAFANISLLTADIFALVWNVVIFAVDPMPMYFLPFTFTISGVVVYDLFAPKTPAAAAAIAPDENPEGSGESTLASNSALQEQRGDRGKNSRTSPPLSRTGTGDGGAESGQRTPTSNGSRGTPVSGYGATTARVRFSQGAS